MALSVKQELKKPDKNISDELYYKIEERVNARRLMLKKASYLKKDSDTEKNVSVGKKVKENGHLGSCSAGIADCQENC